jgi:hypothetical protein
MTKDEALKLALETLKTIYASTYPYREDGSSTLSDESVKLSNQAITAIQEALAQSDRIPDAGKTISAEPIKREWVGLTPADFEKLEQLYGHRVSNDFAFANIVCQVESLLQEKNT